MKFRLLRVMFFAFYFYALLAIFYESLLIFTDIDERALYESISVVKQESNYRPISPDIDEFYDSSLNSYAKGESPRFLLLDMRLLEILYFILIPFFFMITLQYVLVGEFNLLYSLRRNKKI